MAGFHCSWPLVTFRVLDLTNTFCFSNFIALLNRVPGSKVVLTVTCIAHVTYLASVARDCF